MDWLKIMTISRLWLGLYLAFIACKKDQFKKNPFPRPSWILGHRGARSEAPENTLSAFDTAMKLGADGVEFDVSLSRDGIPVVIHDESLSRTTDGEGFVKDHTALELSLLNASKPIPGYKKESVPTLEQTLSSLPDHAIANVELKFSGNFDKPFFVDAVLKVLGEHEQRLRLIISSFDGELLSIFRSRAEKLVISLLLSHKDRWPKSLSYFLSIRPDALHLSPKLLSPMIMKLARSLGLKVAIWTINDISTAKKLWAMGVDGIFTDQVRRMVKAHSSS